MRLIFWFIILPVLIESLSKNEQSLSKNEKSLNNGKNEIKPVISEREAKNLFSIFAKFVKDAENKRTPVRRQDTAEAITVRSISLFKVKNLTKFPRKPYYVISSIILNLKHTVFTRRNLHKAVLFTEYV